VPEAIRAATAGGGAALRRPELGVLRLTHPGDLLVLEAEHEADLLAHLGAPAVRTTIVGGVPVSGTRTIH
jgi:imidazolonepropionase-like amidohydrolase